MLAYLFSCSRAFKLRESTAYTPMAELSTARGKTPTPTIGLGARALSNFPIM